MFSTDGLKALDAVLTESSFDAAARRLHITPSALSQRIRQLEERAGQALVQRGQPPAPTEAGRVLHQLAQHSLALQAEAAAALQLHHAAPAGPQRVAIAVNADSLATWWVPCLAAFAAQSANAHVQFDLRVDDQDHTASLLRSGDVQAAVSAQATPVQGCNAVPLGAMPYAAVCSPAFAAQFGLRLGPSGGVDAQRLHQAPMLVFNRKDRLQHQFLAQVGVSHPGELQVHHVPSASGFVLAASHSLGWGMCPASLCAAALASGALVELHAGNTQPRLTVALHWQHVNWRTQLMRSLTQHVQTHSAAHLDAR